MLVVHIHAARRLIKGGIKRTQTLANRIELDPVRKRHRRREHRVLHVMHRTAFEGRGDQVRPHQRNVAAFIVEGNHLAVYACFQRSGASTGADVFTHQCVMRIHRHVANVFGFGIGRHLDHVLVVGIQHRAFLGDFDHDAFYFGQLFQRIDALQSQMIGFDIQHRADIDVRHAHARAQQSAAGNFQHGEIDFRIGQYHACRNWAGHIALDGALTVDVYAIGRGQSRRKPGHLGDVREHARGRRFAVGAGDACDGNTRRRARRKQHVDHRPRRVARLAFRRRDMHAKSRRRIHFADAAADLFVAIGDIADQKIDAADIESDRRHRAFGHVAIIRVNHVGDIGCGTTGGKIGGRAQHDDLALLRNRIGRHIHARHHHVGLLIEVDACHHFLVADAAPRIFVDLIDQLPHGSNAIADHVSRRALGSGNQFAIHHQQTMIVTFKIGFNDHR